MVGAVSEESEGVCLKERTKDGTGITYWQKEQILARRGDLILGLVFISSERSLARHGD